MKTAMIFAAGLGTRLGSITQNRPKALVEVSGVPALEITLRKLIHFGYQRIIVNVHHFADQIIHFLGSQDWDCQVLLSDECDRVLETGGGLLHAQSLFDTTEPILLHNADILSSVNFHYLEQYHRETHALVTLAVRNRSTSRYLLFDDKMSLSGWENTKTKEKKWVHSQTTPLERYAFSGIQIISPEIFSLITESGKFSVIPLYLRLAKIHNVFGYTHSEGLWMDIGKPETLKAAQSVPPSTYLPTNSIKL